MSARHKSTRRASVEPEIVRMLETLGCVVWRMSGNGLPRLLVIRRNGRWLADVKGPKQWPSKAQEKAWERAYRLGCEVFVLRTTEDARDMVSGALAPWEPKSATMQRLQEEHSQAQRVTIPNVRVVRQSTTHAQAEDVEADSPKPGCVDCRALGQWCQYC